jgi:hypothetical protein
MKPLVVGHWTCELLQIQNTPDQDDYCRDGHPDLEHAPHCGLKSLILSIRHSEPPCQAIKDHLCAQRDNDNAEYQT